MRKDEFVMRGQTPSYDPSTGKFGVEVLNFSGHKSGYAYKLLDLEIYPSTGIGTNNDEMTATIVAGKAGAPPTDPDFSDEGLIATVYQSINANTVYPASSISVINDTFLITQDLILMVQEVNGRPVNWQCRFKAVKMSGSEEAVANYRQFMISDS